MSNRLPARRSQQAVNQMAEAVGRAAGFGAGYGFTVAQLLASAGNFNASYSTVSTTDVVLTGVSDTFQLPATGYVLILLAATGRVSGTGTFAYGSLYIDGVLQSHTNSQPVALWDVANGMTSHTLPRVVLLSAGDHTIDFRIHVDAGNTYNHYQALLEIFGLAR